MKALITLVLVLASAGQSLAQPMLSYFSFRHGQGGWAFDAPVKPYDNTTGNELVGSGMYIPYSYGGDEGAWIADDNKCPTGFLEVQWSATSGTATSQYSMLNGMRQMSTIGTNATNYDFEWPMAVTLLSLECVDHGTTLGVTSSDGKYICPWVTGQSACGTSGSIGCTVRLDGATSSDSATCTYSIAQGDGFAWHLEEIGTAQQADMSCRALFACDQ